MRVDWISFPSCKDMLHVVWNNLKAHSYRDDLTRPLDEDDVSASNVSKDKRDVFLWFFARNDRLNGERTQLVAFVTMPCAFVALPIVHFVDVRVASLNGMYVDNDSDRIFRSLLEHVLFTKVS